MADYKDVYIVPRYSEVMSRSDVDTTSILNPDHTYARIRVPVISANMDTVTDGNMARSMALAGALGAVHRFLSIEENITQYIIAAKRGTQVLMSVGVSGDSEERFRCLYDEGARNFIVDVAHGDHKLMKNMLYYIRSHCGDDVFIVAGNVATVKGTARLVKWGADAVKVGIGPGASCTTKNVTGVTVPQFLAVRDCAAELDCLSQINGRRYVCIADGGVQEVGDIAKALGAGAHFVMSGRLFASCPEAPMPGVYRGMASADAMKGLPVDAMKENRLSDKFRAPEGKTMQIERGTSVEEVVDLIAGGLRSAFSYSNALTLDEFHSFCEFGYR